MDNNGSNLNSSTEDQGGFIHQAASLVTSLISALRELSITADRNGQMSQIQPLIIELLRECHHCMNIGIMNGDGEGELDCLLSLSQIAPPNSILFDVGANRGNYSKKALEYFSQGVKIYCFEPGFTSFEALHEELKDNPSVELHNLAISDHIGKIELYYDNQGSELASLHKRSLNHIGINFNKSEQVNCTTIDSFCEQNRIDSIFLLKLDIEGNEIKALHGASNMIANEKIKFIQFEFGCNVDSRTYLRDFFSLLSEKYLILRILKKGLSPILNYSEILEIFQYSNFIAISKNSVQQS